MKKYLDIILLAIFPFLLIKNLPLMWGRYLIVSCIVIYLFYQVFTKYNLKQLGFYKPTKQDYFYFILALPLVVFGFFLITKLLNFCPPEPLGFPETMSVWLLLFVYSLVNAVGQEILYRSFLINHLERIFYDKRLIFVLGVVLFFLPHIPWGPNLIFASFLMGLCFVWWFMKTKNIVLITLLHVPISMFIIYICFV